MKRILTALGTAAALTLLAGCAGGDVYGSNGAYYGNGYGSSSFGYRQPYPYGGNYQYNNYDRRYGNNSAYYYNGRTYYRR